MGTAECRQNCEEECSKERKCYVDQNEVKVGPFDIMAYPQGTRVPSSQNASMMGGFASAIRNRCGPPTTPSTAASMSDRRYPASRTKLNGSIGEGSNHSNFFRSEFGQNSFKIQA